MKLLLIAILVISSAMAKQGFIPRKFSTKFKQEIISSLTGKKRTSDGTIDYMYPGKIKFTVQEADGTSSVFVSNNKKSWYYTPPFIEGEPGDVVVQSAKRVKYYQFFDILVKGLNSNKLYDVATKSDHHELTFKPISRKQFKLKNVRLYFRDDKKKTLSNVSKIILVKENNKEVNLYFDQFNLKKDFQKSFFDFKIPKNTKITQN